MVVDTTDGAGDDTGTSVLVVVKPLTLEAADVGAGAGAPEEGAGAGAEDAGAEASGTEEAVTAGAPAAGVASSPHAWAALDTLLE